MSKMSLPALLAASLILGAVPASAAKTHTWINGMGSDAWFDGESWDTFLIPGTESQDTAPDDTVIIDGDMYGASTSVNLNLSIGPVVDLSAGTIDLKNGTLTVSADAATEFKTGVVLIGAGGELILGENVAAVPQGIGLTPNPTTNSKNSIFVINGGTLTLAAPKNGGAAPTITNGDKGTISLYSGTLNIEAGTINQTGGSHYHFFGKGAGAVAEVNMTGGSIVTNSQLHFGGEKSTTTVNLSGDASISAGSIQRYGVDQGTITVNLSDNAKIISTSNYLLFGGQNDANLGGSQVALHMKDNASIQKTSDSQFLILGDGSGNGTGGITTVNVLMEDNSFINSSSTTKIGWSGATTLMEMRGTSHLVSPLSKSINIGYAEGNVGTPTKTSTGVLTMKDSSYIETAGNIEIARDGAVSAAGRIAGETEIWGGTLVMTDNARITSTNNAGGYGNIIIASGGGTGRVLMSGNAEFNGRDFRSDGSATASYVELRGTAHIIADGWFEIRDNKAYTQTDVGTYSDSRGAVWVMRENAYANVKIFQVGNGGDGNSSLALHDNAVITAYGTESAAIGHDGGGGSRTGTVTLNNASALNVPNSALFIAQYNAQGELTLNDTATATINTLRVGHWSGSSTGHLNINDNATVTVTNEVSLGTDNGNGYINLARNAAFNTIGATTRILLSSNNQDKNNGGGSAGITLDDNSTLSTEASPIVIGHTGTGSLTVNDTATVTLGGTASLFIGGIGDTDGNGAYSGTTIAYNARTANGTLNVNGGIVDVSGGNVILGRGFGYTSGQLIYKNAAGERSVNTGYYWDDDGTPETPDVWRNADPYMWDDDGNAETPEVQRTTGDATVIATVNLNGGVVRTNGFVKESGTATVTLNGGTIQATSANANFFAGFAAGDVRIGDGGAVFNIGTNNVGIQSGFTGTGDITVSGTGTLALDGDLSGWTGAIDASAGNVQIGNDTILAFVLDGAKTSTIAVDAENVYAGVGNIVFDGNVTLHIALANPQDITEDGTYIFNVFTGAAIPNGNVTIVGTTDATFQYAYIGNGQVQLTVTGVPEPSTYALVGAAGLFGLAALRRRRK